MNKGWECPKCGAVMAPWMDNCNKCDPQLYVTVYRPVTVYPPPLWQPYPHDSGTYTAPPAKYATWI